MTVQVSGVYGYSLTRKRNFGLLALEKLMKGEQVNAFTDQFLSPTYAPFLAKRLLEAAERGAARFSTSPVNGSPR